MRVAPAFQWIEVFSQISNSVAQLRLLLRDPIVSYPIADKVMCASRVSTTAEFLTEIVNFSTLLQIIHKNDKMHLLGVIYVHLSSCYISQRYGTWPMPSTWREGCACERQEHDETSAVYGLTRGESCRALLHNVSRAWVGWTVEGVAWSASTSLREAYVHLVKWGECWVLYTRTWVVVISRSKGKMLTIFWVPSPQLISIDFEFRERLELYLWTYFKPSSNNTFDK